MHALSWAKRLLRSERGNIIVLGAATMPLMIGGAAIAIDTVQLALWKRQMQRAADSSAIAAAYATAQGAGTGTAVNNDLDEHVDTDLANNETPMLKDVAITSGSYAEKTISSQPCSVRGVEPCFGRAVKVDLTAERTLPFMSMFRSGPTTIRSSATAAVIVQGTFCVISLYDGADKEGIVVSGGSELTLGCGMATNSRAVSAVITNGEKSAITASPVTSPGGLDGGPNNFVGKTVLQPYSAPQRDPLAHLPNPTVPPGMDCSESFPVGSDGPTATPVSPGCFKSLDIKGKVALAPGTYYIYGGDVKINSGAGLTGAGVTIRDDWPQRGRRRLHVERRRLDQPVRT